MGEREYICSVQLMKNMLLYVPFVKTSIVEGGHIYYFGLFCLGADEERGVVAIYKIFSFHLHDTNRGLYA